MGGRDDEAVREIVAALRKTAKYGTVCEDVLARTAVWALEGRRPKEALKAAKRKLHQAFGAYGQGDWLKKLREGIEGIPAEADEATLKATCRELMRLHASTAERLDVLDAMYDAVFEVTGRPERVLDVACGLNPLSIPWMNLADTAAYQGIDLDHAMVDALAGICGRFRPDCAVRCGDALGDPGCADWDLVLMFKALMCFERQDSGAALKVLSRYPDAWVAASFPARSLGGKNKGMEVNYASFADALGEKSGRRPVVVSLAVEEVYCFPPRQDRPTPGNRGSSVTKTEHGL